MAKNVKADLPPLQQCQLYLRPEDVERVGALTEAMSRDNQIGPLVRNWSDAARLVIVEGLAVLESRYGVTEPDFADCDLEG